MSDIVLERPRDVAASTVGVTVVIPTYNGRNRIGRCLAALAAQDWTGGLEVIVVDDGSTDGTAEIAAAFANVRVLCQANAGPAKARNAGAAVASHDVVVFTDDDCEPRPDWLRLLVAPLLADPGLVATKGAYLTRQPGLAARFVQLEYEGKYQVMARQRDIDFVDTYSAAYRRDAFLGAGGFDTRFPVACAEDVELSFRLAKAGARMAFVPDAVVFHQHPSTFMAYFRKKHKFAYWRAVTVKLHPEKAIKDSHTPMMMKLQLLALPATAAALAADMLVPMGATLAVLAAFLVSTVPTIRFALARDPALAPLVPAVLFARSAFQLFGVLGGFVRRSGA